jgi:hypothetical protein
MISKKILLGSMDYQGDRLEFFRIRVCPLDNPIGALPNAGLKGNIPAPHS